MANLRLDIVIIPTYDTFTLAVVDASTYPSDPPVVTSPLLEVDVPGFDVVSNITFNVQGVTILNSTDLGITVAGEEQAIPDGIYCFKYTIDPAEDNYVEKTILRVDKLQQKFDEAFMTLDMMECDRAIKNQSKVTLNTIYFFIQGAIASANNCATVSSTKLYNRANEMLDNFSRSNCGCSNVDKLITFYYKN